MESWRGRGVEVSSGAGVSVTTAAGVWVAWGSGRLAVGRTTAEVGLNWQAAQ